MLPLGAGMSDGGAVGGGKSEATAASRVPGAGLKKRLCLLRVQQAPGRRLSGGGTPAEGRAGRDQEVDEGGQRRWIAGAGRAVPWFASCLGREIVATGVVHGTRLAGK